MNIDSLSKSIGPVLLDWYDEHKRSMIWRDNPTPYYVWISEIMLQQTRIEAAKEYFVRFVSQIPDISALAQIEEERLLKLWEGLGYYNRARNLKKAAQIVVERYQGEMPCEYDLLLELPGIGPYTAGAISSIAFGKKAAAVDGNVLRVITRYLACSEDIMKQSFRKKVEKRLVEVMPERPGDFNQALMELGEVVCIPNGVPLCEKCPFVEVCQSNLKGCQMNFPVKTGKKPRRIEKKTVLLFCNDGKVAIRKREEQGLLAGLWEFPMLDFTVTKNQMKTEYLNYHSLGSHKHIFSHVEWHMSGYQIEVENKCVAEKTFQHIIWVDYEELLGQYTLPVAFHKFRNLLFEKP